MTKETKELLGEMFKKLIIYPIAGLIFLPLFILFLPFSFLYYLGELIIEEIG